LKKEAKTFVNSFWWSHVQGCQGGAHGIVNRRGCSGRAVHEYVYEPAFRGWRGLILYEQPYAVPYARTSEMIYPQPGFNNLGKIDRSQEFAMRFAA